MVHVIKSLCPHFNFFLQKFSDERQDVQQKTFTKWINHHLAKGGFDPVKNLYEDLQDGHKLLALLEVLTNQKYVSVSSFRHDMQILIIIMTMNFSFFRNLSVVSKS